MGLNWMAADADSETERRSSATTRPESSSLILRDDIGASPRSSGFYRSNRRSLHALGPSSSRTWHKAGTFRTPVCACSALYLIREHLSSSGCARHSNDTHLTYVTLGSFEIIPGDELIKEIDRENLFSSSLRFCCRSLVYRLNHLIANPYSLRKTWSKVLLNLLESISI